MAHGQADAGIPQQAVDLLSGPNFATLSLVVRRRVRSYVMWIAAVDNDLVVVSPTGSPKTLALIAGAAAAVLVWRVDHPYDYVELSCRVQATTTGEAARIMVEQTLAEKYRGRPYPRPDVSEWTMIRLRPEHTRLW